MTSIAARFPIFALGLISVSICGQASAVPTVFFARDDAVGVRTNTDAKFGQFTATLQSFGVDNIDAAAGFNPTLLFGATGITAASQEVLAQSAPGFQIGTQALLELDSAGFPQANTSFTFNQRITAFGIYVIQGGDSTNNNPTTFRLSDTATNAFVDVPVQVGPGWTINNVFFLGVTDTVPFNKVELIEATDFNDGMLYDNVVAGRLVPEPGSLALLALAGACLLARTRRHRLAPSAAGR